MEIRNRKTGRMLWALRRWFREGKQTFLAPPDKTTIILLCKAKEQFSRSLGMLIHCIAGLDKDWRWKRLYPLSAEIGAKINKWDVIEAGVKDFFAEKNRPESVKIWPSEVKKVGRIEDEEERRRIVKP